MKKYLILSLFVSIFCLAAENPVREKFADELLFFIDFNKGNTRPIISNGAESGRSGGGKPEVCDSGLFGKGLRNGLLQFSADNIINLNSEGAAIFWFSDLNRKAGELFPHSHMFETRGEGFQFISVVTGKLCRTYIQYGPGQAIDRLDIGFDSSKWEPGSWHMLVIQWKPGSFSVSLDGAPFTSCLIKGPVQGKPMESFLFGSGKTISPPEGLQTIFDEFAVLNRNLTSEECRELYTSQKLDKGQ